MKDWTGNKKSVFSTIGAMGHSKEERQNEDFYATDPIAIDKLEKSGIFDIPRKVWECSCGQGHLSERLKEYGHEVFSTDIVDRNYGEKIVDFLSFEADNFFDEIGGVDCIITNPPYKYTTDFVLQALRLLKSGYACFLLKTTALEPRGRYEKIFRDYPPPICAAIYRQDSLREERRFRVFKKVSRRWSASLRMVCVGKRI